MYEVLTEWLTKQVQQTVLEGHQEFLEKLSHWGLKCKFYECSGLVNVPGIDGDNRWEQ